MAVDENPPFVQRALVPESSRSTITAEEQALSKLLLGLGTLGIDRARVFLLSTDNRTLVGTAHVGADKSFIGTEWVPTEGFWKLCKDKSIAKVSDLIIDIADLSLDGNIDEWLWVPLVTEGRFIGGALIHNGSLLNGPLQRKDLEVICLIVSQTAVALDAVRFADNAHAKAAWLNAVLDVSMKVNSSLDLQRILTSTCQAAVELLHVDHSGFVRFDERYDYGHVRAEYPDIGIVGAVIPLKESAAGREFIESPKPFIIPDVASESTLGDSGQILKSRDIHSTLIVPVLGEGGRLLGSFGLDSIGVSRSFSESEVQICQIFADQVAIAIENAERYQETEQAYEIVRSAWATTEAFDRKANLSSIVQKAVSVLTAKSGGIYQYSAASERLTCVADFNRQQNIGKTLKLGEGAAGRLIHDKRTFIIVDNYDTWSGRSRIYSRGRSFGAVLEVPINWQDEIVGVMYVDDEVGRKFTSKDARMLQLLADQAGIILVKAELFAKDTEKLDSVRRLTEATGNIIANLGRLPLDDLLTRIAQFATEILRAESCGVFLAPYKGYLTLEASYGHREGGFKKGRQIRIKSGKGSGLTGHVAFEGKLFNSHGQELLEHPSVNGTEHYHTPSAKCYSMLAIPLLKKIGSDSQLVGLLRIDNKKDKYDQAVSGVYFSPEDEWLLGIFAETVVIAIEQSMFIEQIGKQKENWTRFLDSAATGIVANDTSGNITLYNKEAESIVGHPAADVLYSKVDRLYFDPTEARHIGRLLRDSKSSKISNYDTFVRGKNDRRIAIRLSATRLFDDKGNSVGSVGYFDRSVTEIQALLARANEILSKAENPADGLQALAEMMVSLIPHTFCRILLFNENKKYLLVKAAHPIPRAGEESKWKLRLTKHLIVSNWRGLDQLLKKGKPEVLRLVDRRFIKNLNKLSRLLFFSTPIQALLVIPLMLDNEAVGMIELGELRSQDRSSFPKTEIGLVAQVAAQVAGLTVTSLYRITNRHKKEFEHLHLAATAISSALDLKHVLNAIVVQAKRLLGADSTAIWSYDSSQDRFVINEMVAAGIPAVEMKRIRKEPPRPGGTAYTVLRKGWINIPRIGDSRIKFIGSATRDLLNRIGIASFEGIALKAGTEPVGVLYVNYKRPRSFRQADRQTLENFAAHAALALKRARERDQISNAKINLEVVTSLMALGDNEATLLSVMYGTSQVLKCDAVTLYTYDHSRRNFRYPPSWIGLRKPSAIHKLKGVSPNSIVYRILRRSRPYIAKNVPEDKLFKGSRFSTEENIESCVAIPLQIARQKVGVMFVNYRSPHKFTVQEVDSIKRFAEQAAVAISNAQIYDQSRKRAEALSGLHTAGRAITGTLGLEKTLERITQQALMIAGTSSENSRSVSHVFLRRGNCLHLKAAGSPRGLTLLRRGFRKIDLNAEGSNLGIAGRAAKTGDSQNVGDVNSDPNYNPISSVIRSQISVPLKRGRFVTGVLSIEHPTPNAFSAEDLKNLELLAAQAVIAIENANLHLAARKMAEAFGLRQVLRTIVRCAVNMLGADSSAIWSYDHIHDRFIADEMVAIGIPKDELARCRKEEPKPGRTAYTVLKKGWVKVPNLDVGFLGEPTRQLLQRINTSSFEGIALKVGSELVGVLYVNYNKPRDFTSKDRQALENFAAYAALSLKGARLVDQVRKVQLNAESVAYQTALGDWQASLKSTALAALSVLGADASVLYVYDPLTKKLKHPTHEGLRKPDESLASSVPDDSIAYKMLEQPEPYKVETISNDPLFRDSNFARVEGIVSCVAIPLATRSRKLGVMFVNYRRRHRVAKDEYEQIRTFAVQAGVAISNAQLYDDAQRRSRVLGGLYTAGREITRSLDRKRTLEAITRQALRTIGPSATRKGSFSHLCLKEGNTLRYISCSSKEILNELQNLVMDLNQTRRIGIAGTVAKFGRPRNVGNVEKDPDYNELSGSIRSQLSVPLKFRRHVIGVLSIEHPQPDAFSSEDQKNLELLAAQASVAVDHARQFKDLRETKGVVGSLTALAWMGMASNIWRHEIEGSASTMKLALSRLRKQMQKVPLRAGQRQAIEKRLATLATELNQILNEQLPPPLSGHEGIEPILINDLVNDRIEQYKESGLLPKIRTKLRLTEDDTSVLCSNDWLTRAFNIVMDNAIEAMATTKQKVLTVTTRCTEDTVRVTFKDTGKGIPQSIRRKLFRERIKKRSAKGMGMGLLMLQAIVQAYDGEVSIASSSTKGTSVVLTFPSLKRNRPS